MRCLHLKLCLLFLTACWCTNSSAQEAHQLLLADTTVNYQPQGESILLWDGESEFLFSEADLLKWRVRRPFPEPVINREQAFYPISGFSGSSARYDARAVSINIILPPQVLQPVVASAEGTPTIKPTTGNGLYLDYDLAYLGGDESYYSGFFAPTLFNALGVLHTEHVYRSFDTSSSATESWLRLNTTFTRDDPGRMLTYAAGDVLSAPGPWGDAYRVGGLQIGSNFGTRPSLITAPIPSMLGTAMTPSAVDIYVNGMLRDRQQVEPGNFRIDNLPVVTGAGQVSMVVTDILGREQIYTQDFYTSTDLLRPGLADFSYSLGFLRRNYGYLSDDYGPLAFIGSHRQGMSDQWTMGGRFEVSEHSQMLGASSDWGLNRGGVLSTGLSFSNTQDGIGGAWLLGYQYLESGYNLRAQVTGGTEHQAELDPSFYSLPTKLQFAVGGGWSQGIPGSVSASIIHQSFWNRPSRDIVTLSYSQNLPANYHLSVHSSVVSENGSEFAIGMSLNKSFGDRRSTSTLASREAGATRLRAETQYSLPVGPGVGYRLGATFADENELDANLIGQTETGRYNLDIRSYAGDVAWRANALGSIAWLAGRPYPYRAVASTPSGGVEGSSSPCKLLRSKRGPSAGACQETLPSAERIAINPFSVRGNRSMSSSSADRETPIPTTCFTTPASSESISISTFSVSR